MKSSAFNNLKKAAALILTLALLSFGSAIAVSAATVPTVTVSSVDAKAGETVQVAVTISDCAKFSSYTVDIDYNSEYITAVTATKGIDTMLYMPNLNYGDKVLRVAGGSVDNITENGVLFTIEFSVSADYPGGITVAPLTVVGLRVTEYDGEADKTIYSTSVNGNIVISGAGGSIVWEEPGNSGDSSDTGEHNLTPGLIDGTQAGEYTNPITGSGIGAGEYYFNSDEKIAVPASDAEEKLTAEPDSWKLAGSSSEQTSSSSDGQVIADREEGPDLLTIGLSVGGGLIIILAAVLAYILLRRKHK